MKVTSTIFNEGGPIPAKYTGEGQDISPPLDWSDVPSGAKSLAVICDDPDAPSHTNPRPEGPWVHWVIYNIPSDATGLPEAVARKAQLDQPAGARQGKNDFASDNIGYRGPMPPAGSGLHRYFFKVYALDCQLDLEPENATEKSLLAAIEGHILDKAALMGTYKRE